MKRMLKQMLRDAENAQKQLQKQMRNGDRVVKMMAESTFGNESKNAVNDISANIGKIMHLAQKGDLGKINDITDKLKEKYGRNCI